MGRLRSGGFIALAGLAVAAIVLLLIGAAAGLGLLFKGISGLAKSWLGLGSWPYSL